MAGKTVFVCSKCGKWLNEGERDYCEKYDTSQCIPCMCFAALGITTIKQYCAYLRKIQSKGEEK